MAELSPEQKLECQRLHNLYLQTREAQKARNEDLIDQAKIAQILGVNQSRVSQIMSTRDDSSAITPENALIFARLLNCEVKDFSPRIAVLLEGASTKIVSVVTGSRSDKVSAARQMARGEVAMTKNGKTLHYPGSCGDQVRAFEVETEVMEPDLRMGEFAFVDPTIQDGSGDTFMLIRNDDITYAKSIGGNTYEQTNKKFKDTVFELSGDDVVVGCVIGTFQERRKT
jgi:phage repressor protein C with HTH and peptisase S24 domain